MTRGFHDALIEYFLDIEIMGKSSEEERDAKGDTSCEGCRQPLW
jgi:hypothetical protein